MAGRRLIALHLNGGTYTLGHRNPELIAVLEQAMGRFDIGNHHFPALARTALAEALVATCPPNLRRVVYGSGGGEATDIPIKNAMSVASPPDRKSTRLNSSHPSLSYAAFSFKKKKPRSSRAPASPGARAPA